MGRLGLVLYALAVLSPLGFALNLAFGPQWIEVLLGTEPDGGSGSLETILMVAPAVGAVVLGGTAYVMRLRARPA